MISFAEEKKPVQIDPPMETIYNGQSTLRLSCIDQCGLFCDVQWSKDGTHLKQDGNHRINVTVIQSDDQYLHNLTITDLNVNDTGNYSCGSSDGTYADFIGITVKGTFIPLFSTLLCTWCSCELHFLADVLYCGNPELYDPTDTCRLTNGQQSAD